MLTTTITRRIVLHLLGSAAATGVLAACGSPPPAPTLAPPTPAPPTLAPPPPTLPPPSPTPRRTLDEARRAKIEAAIQEIGRTWAPGVAVSVLLDGTVAYTHTAGLAEVGTTRPITPQSVFMLWHVATNLVATVILRLKEQGKLALDTSVTTYLPYLREGQRGFEPVTLRHLLAHRSGFSGEMLDPDFETPAEDDGALERYLRAPANTSRLNFPDAAFLYNPLNYDLLGDVIAKVTRQPFESAMRQQLLQPLGLTRTTFLKREIDPNLLVAPHALLQSDPVQVRRPFPYTRQHAPSTTLFSSIEDMGRYALLHLNRGRLGEVTILSPAAYDELWTPGPPPGGMWPSVGLGWFIEPVKGRHRTMLSESFTTKSSDTGFDCAMQLAPDDGLGVVAMLNRADHEGGRSARLCLEILEMFL